MDTEPYISTVDDLDKFLEEIGHRSSSYRTSDSQKK